MKRLMIQGSWVVSSAVEVLHLFLKGKKGQSSESLSRASERVSLKLESADEKSAWRFGSPDVSTHRVLIQTPKLTSGNLSCSSENLFNCSRESLLLDFLHVGKSLLPVIQHIGIVRWEGQDQNSSSTEVPSMVLISIPLLTPGFHQEIGRFLPCSPDIECSRPQFLLMYSVILLLLSAFCSLKLCYVVALLKSMCSGKYCCSHLWEIQSDTPVNFTEITTTEFQHSMK